MFSFFAASLLALSSVAHAGVDALYEPNVTWTKRKIHVCWHTGGNDFKTKEKLAVQKIVEQEYTLERTGITFFGWEDCSSLAPDQYDLMIYQDNILLPTNDIVQSYRKFDAEGSATLGQGAAEQIKTETNVVTKISIKSRGFFGRNILKPVMYLLYRPTFRETEKYFHAVEELQMVALHEFGHVAGLRHEHIRSEAKQDPNCKHLQKPKPDAVLEEIMTTAVSVTEYDPNSVMNYCWGATLAAMGNVLNTLPNVPDETLYEVVKDEVTNQKTYHIKIGLSAKDIITLSFMYPRVN
jgi:hypothetical protein